MLDENFASEGQAAQITVANGMHPHLSNLEPLISNFQNLRGERSIPGCGGRDGTSLPRCMAAQPGG